LTIHSPEALAGGGARMACAATASARQAPPAALDRGSLLAQSRFLPLRYCLLLLDERSLSSDLLLLMLDFG